MAEEKKTAGSAKRYGVRYGRSLREKVGSLEKTVKEKQKCPYCNKVQVKRIAAGIWQCRKCNVKFSGGAYTLKREIKTEVVENG